MSFALLQFNPSSVVLMDNDGRIRSLNKNAERLLSTTEADAVGKIYSDVFGKSLSSRVFALMLTGLVLAVAAFGLAASALAAMR